MNIAAKIALFLILLTLIVAILFNYFNPGLPPATADQTASVDIPDEPSPDDKLAHFYSDKGGFLCDTAQKNDFDAKRTLGTLPVAALRAELRNVIVHTQSIDVDFVLINTSSTEIRLAERWNSWGAYQWAFEIVDKDGGEHGLVNPQCGWLQNVFTTFIIAPSGEQVTHCRIFIYERMMTDGTSKTAGAHPKPWPLPATITGIFRAELYPSDKDHYYDEGTNWAGSIATTPVVVHAGQVSIQKVNSNGLSECQKSIIRALNP